MAIILWKNTWIFKEIWQKLSIYNGLFWKYPRKKSIKTKNFRQKLKFLAKSCPKKPDLKLSGLYIQLDEIAFSSTPSRRLHVIMFADFLKRRRIRSSIKQGRVRSVLRKEHWKFDPTWQVLEDKKFPVCDISNDYQQSTSHKAGRKDVLINYNILQKPLRFGNAWPFWHWMGCSISLGRALNQDSRLCLKKSNTNCFNRENVSGHSWHTSCKEK